MAATKKPNNTRQNVTSSRSTAGAKSGGRRIRNDLASTLVERGADKAAARVPGNAPARPKPNDGRTVVPHIWTFQGLMQTAAKVYRNADEAFKHSHYNARIMRNSLIVMECLEGRQRCTALLNHHLEVEDEHLPLHKQMKDDLTKIINRIPRLMEFKRCLLEAMWFGKSANQLNYGWLPMGGQSRLTVVDWKPINGDKLVFRYDDGKGMYLPDQLGLRISGAYANEQNMLEGRRLEKISPTDQGMAYFLDREERQCIALHKHMIEDAAFDSPIDAGAIHGIGIRSRIYWTWFQMQSVLAILLDLVERLGSGISIIYYEDGNAESEKKAEEVANNLTSANVILLPRSPEMADVYGIQRIDVNAGSVDSLVKVFHELMGHQIKRYILGQILSTEAQAAGLGSGLADLHMDSLNSIICYDARGLEESLTVELANRLRDMNFPLARNAHINMRIDTENPNSKEALEAIERAYNMGLKLKAADVRDIVGLAAPAEGDEVLEIMKSGPATDESAVRDIAAGFNPQPTIDSGAAV